jgi:type IV fimbrial biogenesis protein FimT
VELLVTISIAAIILGIGIPSFTSFIDTNTLKGAGEQVYGHLKQARSEAIARGTDVRVNFSADATATWAYSISNVDNCDLTLTDSADAAACTLVVDDGDLTVHGVEGGVDTDDKVLTRYTNEDHDSIVMSTSNFLNGTQITFEPRRGTAIGNTGDILLESQQGKKLLIKVAALGQVRICSPDGSVVGYGYVDGNGADDADC